MSSWKHYFIFSSVWYGEREDVQSSHRALKRPSDTRFSRVIWASACIGTPLYQLDQTLRTADLPAFFKVRCPKGESSSAHSEVWLRD